MTRTVTRELLAAYMAEAGGVWQGIREVPDAERTETAGAAGGQSGTPQAVEAEFGIGETFMAQKVYDQAE